MPLHLTLIAGRDRATLHLPDDAATAPALDVILALADSPAELVARGWLASGETAALTAVQQALFHRDAEGAFIRDGVDLQGPAGGLDPDAPLGRATQPQAGGEATLTVTIVSPGSDAATDSGGDGPDQAEMMAEYQTLFALFQLAAGALIDVTKDDPFLTETLKRLEKAKWIDINVDRAAWELSAAGKAEVARIRQQARQLITRFDIFADVDDAGSTPRFGSGAGADWRIPVYELAGVDPFQARFILGLNDGEWTGLPDWPEKTASAAWYDAIFAPVAEAPAVDAIGRARLQRVMQAGSDIVHDTLDEERAAGIDPTADRIPNPYRNGTL
jgi:hypothetical protein